MVGGPARPPDATSRVTAGVARSSSSVTAAEPCRLSRAPASLAATTGRPPPVRCSVVRDFTDDLAELRRRVGDAHGYLRVDEARRRLVELEEEGSRPDLWDDADRARKVGTELAGTRADIMLVEQLEGQVEDLETLYELGREEGDESVVPEIQAGIDGLRPELDLSLIHISEPTR